MLSREGFEGLFEPLPAAPPPRQLCFHLLGSSHADLSGRDSEPSYPHSADKEQSRS